MSTQQAMLGLETNLTEQSTPTEVRLKQQIYSAMIDPHSMYYSYETDHDQKKGKELDIRHRDHIVI